MVELLSPVHDFISLRAAIGAGANAVYFGVKELNMRITAKNFDLKALKKIADFCHKNNVKAYLTLNAIVYENELSKVKKILKEAKKSGIDAVICWDFSVIEECKKLKLKIILSTQASVSNSKAAEFFYKLGVKRITLARECSLEQIKAIKRKMPKLEIETFIHGAMCVSVSGRCFLSQEIFGKSANRGDCLQPCRRKYLIKDVEEGHELELGEEYVLSPKDLCCVDFIEKLIEAKIDSFKIEGRARSPEYVKVVTEAYREAIDAYHNKRLTNNLKKKLKEKLKTVYNRGFSSGFYLGKPLNEFTRSYGSKATKKKVYLGKVKNYFKKIKVAEIKLEAGNIKLKDMIMIQGPTTGIAEQEVNSIELNHKKIRSAKKGQSIAVKIDKLARENDNVYLVK